MPEQPIKDKTAIAGIGWTEFSRESSATTTTLAARASLMAIQDAGLSVQDIDGVVSYFHEVANTVPPIRLVEHLGMKRCNFQIFADAGGSWTGAAVMAAASLVHSGMCQNVLVYRALARWRQGRRQNVRSDDAGGPDQFTVPFGSQHAAANFGLNATAHMARYGTTTLDFAHLAVTQRKHATLNLKAQMRKPISIDDHQNSRWIVYPYRLLDCCLQTEGAVALVVTSAEHARDLPHRPVYIMSGIGGYAPTELWETNGVNAAPLLFQGAGITPRDVSFAEIYDPFTFMCMVHIEDLGFVKKGEIGAWVREGHNALDGDLPINTHGGLLSEGYIHGLNHVIEAVQQLRPEGVVDDLCPGPHTYDRSMCRQIRNPEIGLVCGERMGSAVLLRRG